MPDSSSRLPAADTLRRWALDEDLKHAVMSAPHLAAVAQRISRRYTAGLTIDEALLGAQASLARGHAVSIEYTGESVRDAELADTETEVFVRLAEAIRGAGLASAMSFDLSHVGSVIDPALGLRNAQRIAEASAELGTALMVSAEASDRTDLVLDLYEALSEKHPHVGITLQVRLHRTAADLERVLRRPGVIRLVKGAFHEPAEVALDRDSPELSGRYLDLAQRLIDVDHPAAIATHDQQIIDVLLERNGPSPISPRLEFEMLMGLGTEALDGLRRRGYRTREYVSFGADWWLYVLNRIAEQPDRVFDAILDADLRGLTTS